MLLVSNSDRHRGVNQIRQLYQQAVAAENAGGQH